MVSHRFNSVSETWVTEWSGVETEWVNNKGKGHDYRLWYPGKEHVMHGTSLALLLYSQGRNVIMNPH